MSKLSQTKQKVLNEFESRTDEWTFGQFEAALSEAMGARYGNYQDAKSTIADADREGAWPNTVKRYVLSNYKSFGNVPGELTSIAQRIFSELSEAEREQ